MKYAWIEDHRDEFSVTRMCARLEVSRSGYNQWRGRKPSDRARYNEQLDAAVVKLHAAGKSSYGRPRILQSLSKQAKVSTTLSACIRLSDTWRRSMQNGA